MHTNPAINTAVEMEYEVVCSVLVPAYTTVRISAKCEAEARKKADDLYQEYGLDGFKPNWWERDNFDAISATPVAPKPA